MDRAAFTYIILCPCRCARSPCGHGQRYPAAYLLRDAGYKISPPPPGGQVGYGIALHLSRFWSPFSVEHVFGGVCYDVANKSEVVEEKTEMIDELQLYIPRSDDGWFYVKMMSDPETMAYNAPWFPPDGCIPDPDSGWVELQKSWIGKAPERFYAFLQRKTDGAFVGDVNYHHNPKQSWCDMGIVIFAPERGKGYGKQGLRLLLDRAFKVDGVSCLHNDFEDARVAAYRIHKAVGFRETGTLDRIIHLELTREDYLKSISICCDK